MTGGSRGLGLSIAEALGEMGAEVLIAARKQAELDQAVAHLRAQGIKASAMACDMTRIDSVRAFAAQALERLGHCDILVNNAGTAWVAPAEDHPIEAWQKLAREAGQIAAKPRRGRLPPSGGRSRCLRSSS